MGGATHGLKARFYSHDNTYLWWVGGAPNGSESWFYSHDNTYLWQVGGATHGLKAGFYSHDDIYSWLTENGVLAGGPQQAYSSLTRKCISSVLTQANEKNENIMFYLYHIK